MAGSPPWLLGAASPIHGSLGCIEGTDMDRTDLELLSEGSGHS